MHLSEMHFPAAAAEREGCAEDLMRFLSVVKHLPHHNSFQAEGGHGAEQSDEREREVQAAKLHGSGECGQGSACGSEEGVRAG